MLKRILLTGSEGVIGRALRPMLVALGYDVVPYDLHTSTPGGGGDVRDLTRLQARGRACSGIVHLAAISRVTWGEADPDACYSTNVTGTARVLDAAESSDFRPWVLLASSREVYGNPGSLPADESTPLAPVNVYGHSKARAEELVLARRRRKPGDERRINAAILRLSNVYGSLHDHPDRVIPAFVQAALAGTPLILRGAQNRFDFTHLQDVVRGICLAILALDKGCWFPPLNLCSGTSTSLEALAHLTLQLSGSGSTLQREESERYAVSAFCGSSALAGLLLDWRPQISLETGLQRLLLETLAASESGGQAEAALSRFSPENTSAVKALHPQKHFSP